ncbi:unnamed protein product [Scytosiphon promiscuus]
MEAYALPDSYMDLPEPPLEGDRVGTPGPSFAMAVEQEADSSVGKKPTDVEAPPMSVAGVEKSAYREGWTAVEELPPGRKAVSSKVSIGRRTRRGRSASLRAGWLFAVFLRSRMSILYTRPRRARLPHPWRRSLPLSPRKA